VTASFFVIAVDMTVLVHVVRPMSGGLPRSPLILEQV